ncbi:hypothetical protein [Aliamphritea hakodatensis]|uniref:hypothetical protein n=1 Tax=Aliamphritea hakodatensis TaxID=2895352 RepID=UPI0022FD750B|nr:hypothetical protein [Aliamphritea hakodatensis]
MTQTVEEFAALEEEQQRAMLVELLGADAQIAPDADLVKMYETHLAATEGDSGEGAEGAEGVEGAAGDKNAAATKPAPGKNTAQKKPSVKKGTNKESLVFVETVRFSEDGNKFFMKKGEALPPGSVTTKTAGLLKEDGHVE